MGLKSYGFLSRTKTDSVRPPREAGALLLSALVIGLSLVQAMVPKVAYPAGGSSDE